MLSHDRYSYTIPICLVAHQAVSADDQYTFAPLERYSHCNELGASGRLVQLLGVPLVAASYSMVWCHITTERDNHSLLGV